MFRAGQVAKLLCAFVCVNFGVASSSAEANITLSWQVKNQNGSPVAGAVISLDSSSTDSPFVAATTTHAVMAQQNQQFTPGVLVVRPGQKVGFPNLDRTQHHVYSFSETKTFELELHGGDETELVQFDNKGLVEIGCNIHDNMQGFILVSATPWIGVTGEDGEVQLTGIPEGEYELSIWHPELVKSIPTRQIQISEHESHQLELDITPAKPVRRGLR
ncbi:MAG: methylamine utilization protein [Pseudomonadaceae bacterium]|nr:methylamine utilization protein [Pseudomonadaceae bacterium]